MKFWHTLNNRVNFYKNFFLNILNQSTYPPLPPFRQNFLFYCIIKLHSSLSVLDFTNYHFFGNCQQYTCLNVSHTRIIFLILNLLIFVNIENILYTIKLYTKWPLWIHNAKTQIQKCDFVFKNQFGTFNSKMYCIQK